MPKVIDLTGQRFGKLVVLHEAEKEAGKRGAYWLCQCDCGNTKVIYGGDLRRGRATSCGCNPVWNKIDLTGQRFGKLVVLHEAEKEAGKKGVYWVCQCDCGNTAVVHSQHLRNGLTKSCGCKRYQNKVDMTGKQFGKWTVLRESEQRNGYWVCQCECGTIREVSGEGLRVGKSASCGCAIRADDITGQRFGKLVVLGFAGYGFWNCQCDCGNTKKVKGDTLRKGKTKSCGCAFGLPKIDLSGQRFGMLTALRRSEQKKHFWVCQCDCGNIKEISQNHLQKGTTKSCGCNSSRKIDMTGKRYGKLVVLHEVVQRKGYWLCQCDCGSTKEVRGVELRAGNVESCGCDRKMKETVVAKRKKKYDLTGLRFGKLVVLHDIEERKGYWLCQCDCGKIKPINGQSLRNGSAQSCGCGRKKGLTGRKIGKLTVMHESKQKKDRWVCQCECGNTKEYGGNYLRSGKVQSCGCMNAGKYATSKIDLTGQRFGKLTVLHEVEQRKGYWLCQCDCGSTKEISGNSLRRGHSNSCRGCIKNHMIGQRFGILTVIRESEQQKDHWVCQCDCGNTKEYSGNYLRAGKVKSCCCQNAGKHSTSKIDLTGQRFGKLTVLHEVDLKNDKKGIFWLCQCDCGNTKIVNGSNLRYGHTKSCGCLLAEQHKIDLTGQHFGNLTVLHESEQKKGYWLCQCDCGNMNDVAGHRLRSGITYSCGCLRGNTQKIDLTGQRFGKLTVLREAEHRAGKRGVYWLCQCDCGNTKEISGNNLRYGLTKSCGCIRGEVKKPKIARKPPKPKYQIYDPDTAKPIKETASGVSVHSLGFKLQYIRERRNMTAQELSRYCEVTRAAVKFWENNLRNPDDDKLDMIAEVLSVDVSALYDRKIRTITDIIHILFEIAEDGCITPDATGIRITSDSLRKAIAKWSELHEQWKSGQITNAEYYDWQDSYSFADQSEKE